jgi:plasmid stability protein
MPVNLSIKNAPDDVVTRLRQRAEKNHRSLQGELLSIIEEAVQPKYLSPSEFLEKARRLGVRTEADGVAMIREDRDRD